MRGVPGGRHNFSTGSSVSLSECVLGPLEGLVALYLSCSQGVISGGSCVYVLLRNLRWAGVARIFHTPARSCSGAGPGVAAGFADSGVAFAPEAPCEALCACRPEENAMATIPARKILPARLRIPTPPGRKDGVS